MRRGEIGVLGGTGLDKLLDIHREFKTGTPYGIVPKVSIGEIGGRRIIYIPRHGEGHQAPPHRVNYRAMIWSLKELGVTRIISTNAVGGIDQNISPGDIVIPHDIVDFTRGRVETFYEGPEVVHIDLTQPYCPELRVVIIQAAKGITANFHEKSVYACAEGPRFETPAEINMMRILGCHVVGMTNVPEAFLAREKEICYASICYVSNMAAGLQERLTVDEVLNLGRKVTPLIGELLQTVMPEIPTDKNCACSKALSDSRF